jgi:hypothetical protein
MYTALFYDSAIVAAQQALQLSAVSTADRIGLYELLGYSYSSIDSTSRAIEAFKDLIGLAPDREPDQVRVSPRITSLYMVALGQALAIRHLGVDSATFLAGEPHELIHFQVSRAAIVRTWIQAGRVSVALDSQSLTGPAAISWNGMGPSGAPLPPGRYQVIVEADAGRIQIQRATTVVLSSAPLDTLPHLAALPGYQEQAETVQPQRDWRPLSIAASFLSVGLAATLALHNSSLGSGAPAGMLLVGGATLTSGLVLSLRHPAPRPVASALLYNHLLRDFLTRRNEEIARDNEVLRRKTLLTIVPLPVAP